MRLGLNHFSCDDVISNISEKSLNKIKKIPSKNNLIITEENNNKLKIIFN